MTANMKPIDAIRNEMNRLGYDLGVDDNRRDICDLLGVSKKSSMKRLCGILGVEYNSNPHGEFKESQRLYLINISNPFEHIEFEMINIFSKDLLFGRKFNLNVLKDIIENQYIVWYNDGQYVISETLHCELEPKYNFKYKMMVIRQVMKGRGYDVSHKTNRKDICDMLGLPSDGTKQQIFERLNISYVKTHTGGKQRWRKIRLTNTYDPSHVIDFRSMREAGRKLNIRQYQLYTYINDPTLTVPYEGNVFTVSFTE